MNTTSMKVLRELTKSGNIAQKDIAEACHISEAGTGKTVDSLITAGLVTGEDKHYTLTEHAHALLEGHRVDNAIIMSAGLGSRFVPLSYETPKGLLEVLGERMIERQIQQLLDVSITDITVVVGYLKEKFEYLPEKYGVNLVYNPDYSTKNNLSTLYQVRHLLKNTYILSSDNYMTKNLFNTYEFESWYSSIYTEGATTEWCLVTDHNDRINEIEIGGHAQWHMYGPVFFAKGLSRRIAPLLEYYYHQPGSDDYFWEDVLRGHLNELEIYANRQPADTVYEFESIEELREYDPSYKQNSNCRIMSIIASIFRIGEDQIKGIKPVKLGMTNKSFLFEIDTKQYICRIPGEGTEKLIDREAEYNNYQAVIPLNITDKIVYMDKKTGVKITEYENRSRVVDINDPAELKACMQILRQIHTSGIAVDHSFDLEKQILFYADLCASCDAILFEDYSLVRDKMNDLLSILKSMDIPIGFSHIDPVCDNFLVLSNGEIKLIDWEYAGMCDPVIDVSMFALYSCFGHAQLEDLMGYYFVNGPTHPERLRVYIYAALGGFLWALWAEYKQSFGVSLADYTLKMYQYSKVYYEKSIELYKEGVWK